MQGTRIKRIAYPYSVKEAVVMTIVDQLKRVGCVSEYKKKEISDELINEIVSAAMWAPSAANVQPWEIVAVRSDEQKQQIVRATLDSHLRPGTGGDERRHWLVDAPLILVVCLDRTRAKARYGEIGEKQFGIQDTGAATQNIRLAAQERGLKSCLVREFEPDRVAEILQLPRHVQPLLMITMGFSDMEPKQNPHLELVDFLHHETW